MNKERLINRNNIFALSVFALMSLILWGSSATFFASPGDTSVDTAVFQMVGYMMKRGYMPYRDTFDHKGPLLYIIHYLGSLINTNYGVGFFQVLNYYITFVFAYKIARLRLNNLESIFTVLICSTIILNHHGEVANVEEFSMGFICVSLFVFLDYLINKQTTDLRVFLAGLSCGAVFMIKMNQVSCWLVFCIIVFVELVVSKEYAKLRHFTFFFTLGFMTITSILIIWLLCNGCLSEAIYDYFIFNFKYISGRRNILTSIVYWAKYDYFLLSLLAVVYFFYMEKGFYGKYLIYLISSYIFIAFLEDTSSHHGLILFPAVIYPIASLLVLLKDNKSIKALSLIVVLAYIVVPPYIDAMKPIPYRITHANQNSLSDELNKICEVIIDNTESEDKISVYGNWDVVYLFTDREHATEYSFQNPVLYCDEKIHDEYYSQLREERPIIMVLQGDKWGDYEGDMRAFIDETGYKLIYMAYREDNNGPRVYLLEE